MDSFAHGNEFDALEATSGAPRHEAKPAIGSDERRMHVRAYNYWVSLLHGREFPSIEDLDPGSVADFGPNSVLLDFTAGRDNPATPYIGSAIREECGLAEGVTSIEHVPSRSLLSRLTDHYLQIIANRAPIGFEAEFVNQLGRPICYRGILMPFSSDGETIDFIYGVINWKDGGDGVLDLTVPATVPAARKPPVLADVRPDTPEAAAFITPHLSWQDGPLQDSIENGAVGGEVDELLLDERVGDDADDELDETVAFDADAGLADHLGAARASAEVCKQQDGRSRAALYRALAMAYDFAVAARRATDDYSELLEDAGVKAQARAPMTPIVKLVFGIDYDKTRLTEFAAALSFAERSEVDFGAFLDFIERRPGGLKALVAAERSARRPASRVDIRGEAARDALRGRPSIGLADLPTNEEFALVLTRRNAAGVHEIVGLVSDDNLLQRAVRRTA